MGNGRVSVGAEAFLTDLPAVDAPVNRHVPVRPAWTCAADDSLWPCPGARVHLRAQFAHDRSGLSVYMSQQLMAAAIELANGEPLPPDLFDRFMGWT